MNATNVKELTNIDFGPFKPYIEDDHVKQIIYYGKDLILGTTNNGYVNTDYNINPEFVDKLAESVREQLGVEWGLKNPIIKTKINGYNVSFTYKELGYHNMTNMYISKLKYL